MVHGFDSVDSVDTMWRGQISGFIGRTDINVRKFIFGGREHIPFHIVEYFGLWGYHFVEDQGGGGGGRWEI